MEKGTWEIKKGFAEMFKGGVIMDVTTAEQAKIAEEAGAVAVMALEGYQQIYEKLVEWQEWRAYRK